jgi:O-methyltransferase
MTLRRKKIVKLALDMMMNNSRMKRYIVHKNTMVSYEPLVTLFQQIRHCEINFLEGDFVECSVWKGAASGLMALESMKYGNEKRHFHMFDIFDDICEPDPAVDGDFAIDQVVELSGVERRSLQSRLLPMKGVSKRQWMNIERDMEFVHL